MNINSTLLVQMANVIVAYLLFEFILIRPLARMMQQEDTTDQQLLTTINQAQEAIMMQEKEFQRQKQEWQLRLRTARPNLDQPLPTLFKLSAHQEPQLETVTLDTLVEPIAEYLIKKAEDECTGYH